MSAELKFEPLTDEQFGRLVVQYAVATALRAAGDPDAEKNVAEKFETVLAAYRAARDRA